MLRLSLVVTSYLLSSVGLLVMLQLIIEGIRQPHKTLLDWQVMIFWLTAWGCHLVMSVAWVKDKRLGRLWAAGGTLVGIASFLVWPAYQVSKPVPYFLVESNWAAVTLMTAQLILVFPSFLLAIWIIRFHWRAPVSLDDSRSRNA